ncbi:MAG: hypothetical protein LQ337_008240, partial [Flavoplaca oasis]
TPTYHSASPHSHYHIHKTKKLTMSLPPSHIFGIIGGAIFAFILLCGAIGATQRYLQIRRLDRDLEANQSLPEAEVRRIMTPSVAPVMPEMAHVGVGGARGRMGVDGGFVEIDLNNPDRTRSLFEKARSRVGSGR